MSDAVEHAPVVDKTERRSPAPGGARERVLASYADAFARFDRAAAADQPAWLTGARRAAIARFGELGFPTTRQERWRFTSVAPIAERITQLPSDGLAALDVDAAAWRLDGVPTAVVLVNGRFAPELSTLAELPAGAAVTSLRAALASHADVVERHLTRVAAAEQEPFVALNTAFLDDGAFVSIPDGVVLETPLQIVFVSTGLKAPTAVVHPRVLVVAGAHSQARLVETYVSTTDLPYLSNGVTEVVLGADAVVDHYKLQREGAAAFHIGSLFLTAARGSTFSSHSLTLGGQLVRNDVVATLAGEGIECTLNGLYLGGDHTLVDNHTTIDHARPHCASHEVYKGVLWDEARAVFNGKIVVRPDAQKTDAKQTNKALLLSDDAQINTKPELEIFADDVKCTHGAAIGQLDDDALFYLRARGIGAAEARAILIHAFAGDIIHRIQIPSLRETLEAELTRRLPTEAA